MITVKYYNKNLLLTVDLQVLFEQMAERLDADGDFLLTQMTQEEKMAASAMEGGVRIVRERFWILSAEGQREMGIEEAVCLLGGSEGQAVRGRHGSIGPVWP